MDLEGIMLNKRSQTENLKKLTHRKREESCEYQRGRVGEGQLKEGNQNVQTSSCKISKC